MADLGDLHAALVGLNEPGKNAKVSFYYLDDLKMLSGAITVSNGQDCSISFQQLPPLEALEQIARLKFAKVTTLPTMVADAASDLVPLAMAIDRLDPAHQTVSAPPEQAPAADIVAAAASLPAASVPANAAEAKPHVFYSHLAMQKDATDLLTPLFGVGAAKKIEDIAKHTSPVHHPGEFLDKCRQQAAMMLGAKKAEALFQPLFDKLSS